MGKKKEIIEKIKNSYRSRSIQLIISVSFTLVSVISMTFMGIAFYTHFINSSMNTANENNEQILDQLSLNLNSYIRNMMSVSDSMYYNVIKNKDLTNDSINDEMNLLYEANKDNLISIACISDDGALITAVPVATRKKGVDFKKQEWFTRADSQIENLHFSTPHVQNMFESSNYRYYWVVSLSRSVELTYIGHIERGILLVDMNFSGIEQIFSKVNERGTGYVYLADRNGEIIYHPAQKAIYSGLMNENNKEHSSYEDGVHLERFNGEQRSVVIKTVGYTGWKIVSVTPTREIAMNHLQLRFFMLVVCTVTILLILFGNIFISDRVTVPIRKLETSINYLDEGNMDADKIYIGGSHEIQHLGKTIVSMVRQMQKLMEDMIREQKEKQKSELDALQSQINPHFLYNTLDSVVWMIECEKQKDAISMIKALASLFRISLSRGNNIITIRDEITHARNYLEIQKVRYKNRFSYEIDIDPEIEECVTIKLIIQPLIENAIYYGVEHMDGDGRIMIKGYEKNGDIYIDVSDNGMGIPQDTLQKLLTDKTKTHGKGSGIGLWNVHQRISLYFKNNYGLSIKSELDEGTVVTVHLPHITYEEYKGGGTGQ